MATAVHSGITEDHLKLVLPGGHRQGDDDDTGKVIKRWYSKKILYTKNYDPKVHKTINRTSMKSHSSIPRSSYNSQAAKKKMKQLQKNSEDSLLQIRSWLCVRRRGREDVQQEEVRQSTKQLPANCLWPQNVAGRTPSSNLYVCARACMFCGRVSVLCAREKGSERHPGGKDLNTWSSPELATARTKASEMPHSPMQHTYTQYQRRSCGAVVVSHRVASESPGQPTPNKISMSFNDPGLFFGGEKMPKS